MRDKSNRLSELTSFILSDDKHKNDIHRTGQLAKCDLLTQMVGEFPELQGIMGRYYALNDGEHPDVAAACMEHYAPRFAGDELPKTEVGTVLALADKLETLIGIWGIGLAPTGEKDPFALRRHALGICRILVEKKIKLSVVDLINYTLQQFPDRKSTRLNSSH